MGPQSILTLEIGFGIWLEGGRCSKRYATRQAGMPTWSDQPTWTISTQERNQLKCKLVHSGTFFSEFPTWWKMSFSVWYFCAENLGISRLGLRLTWLNNWVMEGSKLQPFLGWLSSFRLKWNFSCLIKLSTSEITRRCSVYYFDISPVTQRNILCGI